MNYNIIINNNLIFYLIISFNCLFKSITKDNISFIIIILNLNHISLSIINKINILKSIIINLFNLIFQFII